MEETKKTVAVLTEQIKNICDKHEDLTQVVLDEKKRLNHNLERIGNRLDDLNAMVGSYRVELRHEADKKPSWGTALAITSLASICSALAVYLLTH